MSEVVSRWHIIVAALVLACMAIVAVSVASKPAEANHGPLGFNVKCTFTKHEYIDPVTDNPQHLHAFFGAQGVTAGSTPTSLRNGTTACNVNADKAAYWMPSFSENGVLHRPEEVHVYYRKSNGASAANTQIYPNGLEMVVGNADATSPQPIVEYSCSGGGGDGGSLVSSSPINCYDSSPGNASGVDDHPTARIFGPDCYSGAAKGTAAGDFQNHTAYAVNGQCPAGFFPGTKIRMDFRWPEHEDLKGAVPSSGSPYTFHADFMDGWNRQVVVGLNEHCIQDGTGCNLTETKQFADNFFN